MTLVSSPPSSAVSLSVSTDASTWESLNTTAASDPGTFTVLGRHTPARFARLSLSSSVEMSSVSWLGCSRGGGEEACSSQDHRTRVSTNISQYRHLSYASSLGLLFLCDERPGLPALACSTHRPSTGEFSELPAYVSHLEGHSPGEEAMYLRDTTGAVLASPDGVSMILVDSLPADLEPPTGVPGLQREQLEESSIQGGYTADYDGVKLAGNRVMALSSCCL